MTTRPAFEELSEQDQRLHLMLDHNHRPQRFGGVSDSALTDEPARLAEKHAIEHRRPDHKHDHLPPVIDLPATPDTAERDPLVISANGDAWELLYELINYLAGRKIAVELNGAVKIELSGIDGEYYESEPMAHLLGKVWDESAKEYDRTVAIPMFRANGTCAITKVVIL